MAIRFDEEDVRPMGRPAYGVRGMNLGPKDYIVGMAATPKSGAPVNGNGKKKNGEEAKPVANLILTVTENGYGKRTPVDSYRLTGRGGKGIINVKTTERNGKVVGILLVSEQSEAMLISQYGKIIRMGTDSIREAGRATQGVRLLNLEGGDKVAAAVVIPLEEAADDEPTLLQ
jgi:DNA gyrase subunit A